MFLKTLYIVLATFLLSSCSRLYVKLMTQKPEIESPQSITEFLVRNKLDTTNSYYLGADIEGANKILKEYRSYVVFDSLGNELYNADFTCPYNYITAITSENPDSSLHFNPGNKHIINLLEGAKRLDGTPFDPNALNHYKYYVLIFWQKFMGGSKGYKEKVTDVVQELRQQNNILVMKINADIMVPTADAAKTKFKLQLINENQNAFFKIN